MIEPATTLMAREASEAPALIAQQRAANAETLAFFVAMLKAEAPALVATIARGSSDHATTYLRHLIETTVGVPALSLSPSLASVYGAAPNLGLALVIAVSQSGASPDIITSVTAARDVGAATLALVNVESSPLARVADTVLPLHAGVERSVAATKSAIATMAQALAIVADWSGNAEVVRALDDLPDLLGRAWAEDWSPLVETLRNASGLYVIGRGPAFGIAQEMALKLKETCGLHAEAFSAAEIRHGPMALVGPGFPVLILRQEDQSAAGVDALAEELAARGGPVLVAGGKGGAGIIPLPTPRAHPVTSPIAQLMAFYRAANTLSVARGYDPDRPPYLKKVTKTI